MEVKSEPLDRLNNISILKNKIIMLIIIALFFLLGWRNYLIFHTFIEFTCVFVGFSIVVIAQNTYDLRKDVFLLFLGISYGFITAMNLIHVLMYQEMNIYFTAINGTYPPLWLGRIYVEAITLFIISLSLYKRIKIMKLTVLYSLLFILFILSIVYWRVYFQDSFTPQGIYIMKKANESITTLIILGSLFLLYKNKHAYQPKTYRSLIHALGFYLIFQFCYLFYLDYKNIFEITGHIFRALSYYFIYKAIVEVNLREPYYLLVEKNKELKNTIMEKIQIQENLQRSEITLQKILNSTYEGIIVVNEKDEIIHYNQRFLELWGISSEFMKNNTNEQARQYAAEKLKNPEKFIEDIEKALQSKAKQLFEFELKDGRCFESYGTSFELNHMKVWVISIRDITKRKNQEKFLKESKRAYRLLFDSMPDSVLLSQGGKIIYGNLAFKKLFHIEQREELLNINPLDLLHPSYREFVIKRGKEIQENNNGTTKEYKLKTWDNKSYYVEEYSTIFSPENNIVLTIARDITEKKIAENLRKKMEEKDKIDKFKYEFYANISHELKTPINIIYSAAQMIQLELGNSSSKAQKYTGLINQNCNRVIRLINNLIDINKIGSGHFTLNMKNVNIVQVVEDLVLSAVPYLEIKEIEFTFDTDVEEKIISVDINSIERIILNLLSNAIKFTPRGGKIQVLLKDLGKEVEIFVKDTGIGIKKDKLESIFKIYEQGDISPLSNPRGSGIGLALVKNMVKLHGGTVKASSELGMGSTFKVILPAKKLKEDNLVKESGSPYGDKDAYSETVSVEFSDIMDL